MVKMVIAFALSAMQVRFTIRAICVEDVYKVF